MLYKTFKSNDDSTSIYQRSSQYTLKIHRTQIIYHNNVELASIDILLDTDR